MDTKTAIDAINYDYSRPASFSPLDMDPVSAVGIAINFQQLAVYALLVSSKLWDYILEVKDAPARSKQLRDEIQLISATLQSLACIREEDTTQSLSHQLRKAAVDCTDMLNNLETRVAAECTQGYRRLIWPIDKAFIDRALKRIERSKATFNLALQVYQTYQAPVMSR
jgi:hypothetical protein